jgi:hypothetical protein
MLGEVKMCGAKGKDTGRSDWRTNSQRQMFERRWFGGEEVGGEDLRMCRRKVCVNKKVGVMSGRL